MRTLSIHLMSCLERHRSVLVEMKQKKEEKEKEEKEKEDKQISNYISECFNDIVNKLYNKIEYDVTPECGYFKNVFRLDTIFSKTYESNMYILNTIKYMLECHYRDIPGIGISIESIGNCTLEFKLFILI